MTVEGAFQVDSEAVEPFEPRCCMANCSSTYFRRGPVSPDCPDGLSCVVCGEGKRHNLYPQLVGHVCVRAVNGEVQRHKCIVQGWDLVRRVCTRYDEILHAILYNFELGEWCDMLADVSYEATYIVRGCMVLDVIDEVIDLISDDDDDVGNAPATDAAVPVPIPANQDVNAPRDVSDDASIGEETTDNGETPPASQEATPVDQEENDLGNEKGNDASE